MAGIVLKDRSGNEIEYEAATQLNVPCYNANGDRSMNIFTKLSSLTAHIVSTEDGVNYKIEKYISSIGGAANFFEFSDSQCKEYGYENTDGSYKMMVFLYPKTLTIGETYKIWDML